MNLNFQFDSFNAFMNMAGHGPYVWGCYALGFLCLAYLGLSPLLQRKRFLKELQRVQRIEEQQQKQANSH